MATYQGKSVELNKVTRIAKNESEYGAKTYKVYVQDGKKIKKITFGNITTFYKYSKKEKEQLDAFRKRIGMSRKLIAGR
jgi:hypothetical protein